MMMMMKQLENFEVAQVTFCQNDSLTGPRTANFEAL